MSIKTPRKNADFYHSFRSLCLILGLTSLSIFSLNLIAIALPPEIYSVQWRTNFLDQVSNRSIGLFFGMGFTMYGFSESRLLLKKLAFLCLVVSIVFGMFFVSSIHDGLALKEQALVNIESQATQLENQLLANRNGSELTSQLSTQQFDEALQQISRNQKSLVENAKADITKATFVSAGNLFLIGLGLIALSRLGLKWSRLKGSN